MSVERRLFLISLTLKGCGAMNRTNSDKVSIIDQEHSEIDRLIQLIGASVNNADAKAAAIHIVEGLIDLSIAHTANEEELMILNKVPNFQEHSAHHGAILTEMTKIQADIERSEDIDWVAFATLINNIYKAHRIAFDEPFLAYIQSNGRC